MKTKYNKNIITNTPVSIISTIYGKARNTIYFIKHYISKNIKWKKYLKKYKTNINNTEIINKKNKRYTEFEIEMLKNKNFTTIALSKILNRSYNSVEYKRRMLNGKINRKKAKNN